MYGYGCKDTHSKECIEWLSVFQKQWLDEGRVIDIQHARSPEGEKVIRCEGQLKNSTYKVDGYFEYKGERYVCEYHGCNFHWCVTCFPHGRETIMNKLYFHGTKMEKYSIEGKGIKREWIHCI